MNNLFDFATKELSQDAFLCWLINWLNYKKENIELYNTAKKFINLIINEINIDDFEINILKQYKKIDIFVELIEKKCRRNKYAIIIEDKKFTTEHNKQIEKYKEKIEQLSKKYKRLITVYYKPYDELYNDLILADVKIYRKDMLKKVLNANINNSIYADYKSYLQRVDKNCKNIDKIPLNKWKENKELYYKFASEYNKNIQSEDLKMSINPKGLYIDWYRIVPPKEYRGFLEYIYLSATTEDLRIRAIVKEKAKYNDGLRRKLQNSIEKISKEFNMKNLKIKIKEGKKTFFLAKYKISPNLKYEDFLKEMKKLEEVLNKL